jgi:low temperature requirement protein LtrA
VSVAAHEAPAVPIGHDGPSEAEEERRTSYLELFFDLVFVFAITQVTLLLLSNTSVAGFARAALVLALVWWAWSGFTWMTNAIDIENQVTKLLFLAGMAGALFVALAVPGAYGDEGAWFAIAYVFVRVLNIALYGWGLRARPAELAALMRLVPFFLVAPALVLAGGLVDSLPLRSALWALSIVVDLVGVLTAGRENDWRVSPAHFAERYALIVIIALGESIVAIGTSVADLPRDAMFAVSVAVAFAGVAALWFAYFGFVSGAVERALQKATPSRRGPLARDVFTIFHYPIVLGIVLFAVGAKKVLAHPEDALSRPGRAALGFGVAFFLAGFVLARYRIVRTVGRERAAAAALTLVAVVALRSIPAVALLAAVTAIVVAAVVVERLRYARAPSPLLRTDAAGG